MATVKKSENENSGLETFLTEFEKLTIETTNQVLQKAKDEDEKAVIKAFSPTLINQVTELNNFIRENASNSSRQQMAEIDQVLRVTSGVSLVQNAKGIFPSLGSIIGKLGLSRIIKEIKKVIREILDLFGILPPWFDALANLIDELFDAILGAGSASLATILSVQEQNYLAELTQLAKLQQANKFKHQDDNDDY